MSEQDVEIHGVVEPGFERIREAFAANFSHHGELGAAVCLYRDGRPVVDLWGGIADLPSRRPWQQDTTTMVFSTTKGVSAIVAHHLVERGLLDLDAPVARYWPEFAAHGKAEIPVRWLLTHRAGLAAVDGQLTFEDLLAWNPVVTAIAAQPPQWTPGSRHGYHVRTFGWTIGEVVRRITGRSLGRYLADEIAKPLGLDVWIGLPESEESRCATLVPARGDSDGRAFLDAIPEDSLLARAFFGPSRLFAAGYDDSWNRREIRAAEMPSSNGIADARSLARLYAATLGEVDGRRILSRKTVDAARAVQSRGPDLILGIETAFGTGFALPPMLCPKAGEGAFGHPGAGGSLAFADPEAGIAFGYVMNQMKLGTTGDERSETLVVAAYDCLGT
jgi:CubicO group peptidase (beta-lactamase class C family)